MKFLTSLLLLSSAFALDVVGRRRLEDAAEEEEDFSWMSGYTLKYEQCFQSGGVDFVYFTLCPADAQCVSGCEGGTQYVSQLNFFVDAFTEAQLGAREYACEMARENCDENYDDDANLATCYAGYNAQDCDEDGEGNFNLQEFIECNQFGDDYYVGPYCAEDGDSIFLGYFTEDSCTNFAQDGLFEETYGYQLDYSDYTIVADECANCREHGDHQNDGDAEDEDDVLEQCEELYAAASSWADVAEQYGDKVNAIGGGTSKAKKAIISILAILGLFGLAGCCWFAFGKNKKEPLLTTE